MWYNEVCILNGVVSCDKLSFTSSTVVKETWNMSIDKCIVKYNVDKLLVHIFPKEEEQVLYSSVSFMFFLC